MYSILATLRFDELKAMINGARKNRALAGEKQDYQFIQIEQELCKDISNVMIQKRRMKT